MASLIVLMLLTSSCNRFLSVNNTGEDIDSIIVKSGNASELGLINEKGLMITQETQRNVFVHTAPTTVYVDPAGRGDGSSKNSPVKLEQALQSDNVIAGDTIMLLDGIYAGNYSSIVTGKEGNKIIIRPLHCYQAIIDGSLTIGDYTGKGAYTIVRNLHIFYSGLPRGKWSDPDDTYPRPSSLNIAAPNCMEINNLIHDGGIGLVYYQAAENNIAYGNLCWNNGWPDQPNGSCQSTYYHGTGQIVKHNFFGGGFKRTFAGYGKNGGVYNHQLIENVMLESKITSEFLLGAENVACSNIIVDGNHTIGANFLIGLHAPDNDGLVFQNNRCYRPYYKYYGAANTVNWKNVTILKNVIVGQAMWFGADNPVNNYTLEGNKYYSVGNTFPIGLYATTATVSFAEWQALGFDLTGSFTQSLPGTNEIFVYPNEYPDPDDPRMGIVVIWNWEELENVEVDLSKLGLEVGKVYQWRQAQDPLVDIDTWVCDGDTYSFPMTGHTVAKPMGFDEELIPSQFPTFGCFIIERL